MSTTSQTLTVAHLLESYTAINYIRGVLLPVVVLATEEGHDERAEAGPLGLARAIHEACRDIGAYIEVHPATVGRPVIYWLNYDVMPLVLTIHNAALITAMIDLSRDAEYEDDPEPLPVPKQWRPVFELFQPSCKYRHTGDAQEMLHQWKCLWELGEKLRMVLFKAEVGLPRREPEWAELAGAGRV